ncbi:MAG TPA: PSD1 and planctomycete cytochrome C domain-containing protein [Gemmataceae bacterium]|nr:PSD1 and planctomycete cytochrome C domain-containing protein [Gemmataceae bacterium]
MLPTKTTLLFAVAALLGLSPVPLHADGPSAADVEFFEKKVRPVFVAHCFKCHGNGKAKGGLSLASRDAMMKGGDSGPVIVPGQPAKSPIIQAIRYEGETQMPPKKKLTERDIAELTAWVQRGAPWPAEPVVEGAIRAPGLPITAADRAFWSFRPIADPPLPAIKDKAWPRKPLDHFILAKLEGRGLHPVRPADKHALLRRVTLDLTGLPPTPEEVHAFVRDSSPNAFAKVVDRLLASPHYGERWGRHWLDVARYGEDQAHTFAARLFPGGYRYRDWVVKALNDDIPYDHFIIEQIAGDLLKSGEAAEHLPALGFFALGPHYYEDGAARKLVQATELDDRIDTLTRGFLGLTVSCARCHDHKFDPISQSDYYSLAGVFQSTKYQEVPVGPASVIEKYKASQAKIREQDTKIKQFVKAEGKGQGEKKLNDAAKKKLKDLRRELDQLKKTAPPAPPIVHTLSEGQPADMRIYLRGNPDKEGDVAPRRFLRIVAGEQPPPFKQGSGRLELAQAIASPKNPLTARVLVNRIWQYHFGKGLVGTPSNFGKLGERPTHPELLDHLATRFIASGWSMKALHREILLSATYQLSCQHEERNNAVDPGNQLLGRMNRQRLDVEAWRDALLAVSGELDDRIGGSPADLGDGGNKRRTLYAKVSRHNLSNLLRLFDFPDPNITSGSRPVTIVPLQQLFVLNSEFMIARARALAGRLAAEDKDDAGRIRKAFVRVYGRDASEREMQVGLAFLHASEEQARPGEPKITLSRWEQYAQVLLSANEFTFVD